MFEIVNKETLHKEMQISFSKYVVEKIKHEVFITVMYLELSKFTPVIQMMFSCQNIN